MLCHQLQPQWDNLNGIWTVNLCSLASFMLEFILVVLKINFNTLNLLLFVPDFYKGFHAQERCSSILNSIPRSSANMVASCGGMMSLATHQRQKHQTPDLNLTFFTSRPKFCPDHDAAFRLIIWGPDCSQFEHALMKNLLSSHPLCSPLNPVSIDLS